jgi:hypothetical protein
VTRFGELQTNGAEVNGELLQRTSLLTKKQKVAALCVSVPIPRRVFRSLSHELMLQLFLLVYVQLLSNATLLSGKFAAKRGRI